MSASTVSHTAGSEDLLAIAQLVSSIRPEWPAAVVVSVLQAHAHQATCEDLTVAAVRAAARKSYRTPKTIGWRGPHWEGCKTGPTQLQTAHRCRTCGKPQDLCETQRVGLDDDHEFEPAAHRVVIR